MHWEFSDEQQMYRAAIKDWLAHAASTDRVRSWLDAGETRDLWNEFVAAGWAGVGFGEVEGGQGGGVLELALTSEQLGFAAAPSTVWLATAIASPALGPAQLRTSLEGGGVALLCDAGAPPDEFTAVAAGPDGGLTGEVPRVLGAGDVTTFVAVVQTPEGPALHLVDAAAPGVEVDRQPMLDRTRVVGRVSLDGAPSQVLPVAAGQALARATMLAALLLAADALGALERMLDMAVLYAGQRHQFGVPIGSFQAVKHAAAELEVSVEAGRSALFYAAASVDAGTADAALQAAAVKAELGEHASVGADVALALHGAIGYTWEHDLQLFYKRAKLDSALFGQSPIWLDRVAAHLLDA